MKLTVKNKLIAAFGLIILLTSFLGIYSILIAKSLNDRSNEITRIWFNGNDLAHTMDTIMADYRLREYRHVATTDETLMANTDKELKTLKDNFEKALNDYEGTIVIQEDKDLTQEIKAEYPKYFEVSDRLLSLSNKNKKGEANELILSESKQYFDTVNNTLGKLVKLNQEQANLANQGSNKTYEKSRIILVAAISTIILINIAVAICMILSFSRRTKFIIDFLNKTANLDLIFDQNGLNTINKFKDEFFDMGMALTKMRNTLRETINRIKQNSIYVSSNADNLSNVIGETSEVIDGVANAVNDMAQGSTDLAKNVEDSADNLNMLADEINEIVKSSDLMKNSINVASEANFEGIDHIKKLKEAVKENSNVAENVATQVELLDSKSESIGKISETIKTIASQINLLSLNTAIEAARAGEHGKGFAVVANEIGKLAAETANSIDEIDSIINDVRNEFSKTKSEMEKASTVINQTNNASIETEKAFQSIDTAVSNIINQIESLIDRINNINHNKDSVLANVTDISAIAEESASTTEEISASMQEQSASMEQISESAKDLKQISAELENLTEKFRT
jgi:methyl-accepting chemotaxis protein